MARNYVKKGNNGGAREGAGKKPGTPNQSTLEFRNHAREYTHAAIELHAEVMHNKENPYALRMEAANSLCDRGHGKAVIQASIEHEGQVQVTYKTVEEVRIALMEKGIDVQRVPFMIEDFRKQVLSGNRLDTDYECTGT